MFSYGDIIMFKWIYFNDGRLDFVNGFKFVTVLLPKLIPLNKGRFINDTN